MNEILDNIAQYAAIAAEVIAFLFIIFGVITAVLTFVKKALIDKSSVAITESRTKLGHYLSLGLEFLIGADILKTALSPSWDDLGQLAAIVGIRTILNFFLLKELSEKSIKKRLKYIDGIGK
jgi:uncharacterized membrane protein